MIDAMTNTPPILLHQFPLQAHQDPIQDLLFPPDSCSADLPVHAYFLFLKEGHEHFRHGYLS